MSLDLSRVGLLKVSERAAELFTEIYSGLEDRRVDPGVTRAEMHALFENSIGEEGVGLARALEEFAEKILPHSMGTAHPLYFGLVNSSPLPAGPLADLLVSSLNNNGGAFHQSPAISATERVVIQEFARLCGLGDEASGMILPGGHEWQPWWTSRIEDVTRQTNLYARREGRMSRDPQSKIFQQPHPRNTQARIREHAES